MTKLQVMKDLLYVVYIYLNVFGVLVFNWIMGNADDTLIVAS
jgi:hypothetical protein